MASKEDSISPLSDVSSVRPQLFKRRVKKPTEDDVFDVGYAESSAHSDISMEDSVLKTPSRVLLFNRNRNVNLNDSPTRPNVQANKSSDKPGSGSSNKSSLVQKGKPSAKLQSSVNKRMRESKKNVNVDPDNTEININGKGTPSSRSTNMTSEVDSALSSPAPKKPQFERRMTRQEAFDIRTDSSLSDSNVEKSTPSVETDDSVLKSASPKRPFQRRTMRSTADDFNVEAQDSVVATGTPPSLAADDSVLKSASPKRPFQRRTTKSTADDFNIEAQDSVVQTPTPDISFQGDESSSNNFFKSKPFQRKKPKNQINPFNVSSNKSTAEEAKASRRSSQEDAFNGRSDESNANSALFNDSISSRTDSSLTEEGFFAKSKPFQRKEKKRENPFSVSLNESETDREIRTRSKKSQENGRDFRFDKTNSNSSTEAVQNESFSSVLRDEEGFVKPKPFQRKEKKKTENAFDVLFSESPAEDDVKAIRMSQESTFNVDFTATVHAEIESSQKTSKKDDFNVSLAESTADETKATLHAESARGRPFARKTKNGPEISVLYAESAADETELSEIVDRRRIFERKGIETDFEVSRNDSIVVNEEDEPENATQTTEARRCSNPQRLETSPIEIGNSSGRNSSGAENSVEDSARDEMTYEPSLSIGNDDNLNEFLSDRSEEAEENGNEPRVSFTAPTATASGKAETPDGKNETSKAEFKRIADDIRNGIFDLTLTEPEEANEGRPKRNVRRKTPGEFQARRRYRTKPFHAKDLHDHFVATLEPRFGVEAEEKAEELISVFCDVMEVILRRNYQKKPVEELKKKLAKWGLIETTYDFYRLVRNYLPGNLRYHLIPALQPFSCVIYPPQEGDPLEKIL